MHTLHFDNSFLRELPADPSDAAGPREVPGAAYSQVMPTPVAAPRLLAHSAEMAATLGFDAADLASDAFITIALFASMGIGVAGAQGDGLLSPSPLFGSIAGIAVALIFYLRMRIESLAGKSGTQQAFAAGFETEDVLYLLPLVTLFQIVDPFLVAASIGAPLFALWVALDYRRVVRKARPSESAGEAWVSR